MVVFVVCSSLFVVMWLFMFSSLFAHCCVSCIVCCLLFGGWTLLFVLCYLLFAGCWLLFVVCCLLFAVDSSLSVVGCVLRVVRCLLVDVCSVLFDFWLYDVWCSCASCVARCRVLFVGRSLLCCVCLAFVLCCALFIVR